MEMTYDIKSLTRVGHQLGSTWGGTFAAPDGIEYYVKTPLSSLHRQNEILASLLYELAEVPAVKMRHGDDGTLEGKLFSQIISGTVLADTSLTPQIKKQIQDAFVIDAWLANWDVIGLAEDNIVIDSEGTPFRIDVGGALLFRALGGEKGNAFSYKVSELDTLRDPARNQRSSRFFGDMTEDDLKASASKLLKIFPQDIDELVDSAFDGDVALHLKTTLKARRDYILQRFNLLS